MTSLPLSKSYQPSKTASQVNRDEEVQALRIDEVYWGYVILNDRRDPAGLVLAQTMGWVFGTACAIAAIALWVVPSALSDVSLLGMRLGISVTLAGLSALLLWFASRGSKTEFHVDTSLGELREVVRNRAGRPTLLGSYGFGSIGGVFIERGIGPNAQATLMLRYGNTAKTVPVVTGPLDRIEALRDRLGRDLLIDLRFRRPQIEPPAMIWRAA